MKSNSFRTYNSLTHNFFQNNVWDKLWKKVSETYEGYSTGQKGGPLFCILMMNHLLSDTEEAASALHSSRKCATSKSKKSLEKTSIRWSASFEGPSIVSLTSISSRRIL
jgi:hypothetical protein